jgi:PAS domain S-box-containing protein
MDQKPSSNGQEMETPDFCRAMVDASPTPMAFLVGKSHIIRFVNRAFCQLTGETEPELIGKQFSQAMPESSECSSLLDRVYGTGQAETHMGQESNRSDRLCWSYIIWPVVSADKIRAGTMIQVTETTPFHVQTVAMNQALVIGSVRQHELTEAADALNAQLQAEIIQRKHAEAEMEGQQLEIKASEQRFRGLIEAIPQIVWTATPEGTLDFANSRWFECFGVDLDTFNETGWSALLHADDQERSLEVWTKGLKSKSAFQIQHRLRNPAGGAFRWYFTRAVPIGTAGEPIIKWFGTSTDVDDHKRAEMALFAKQKLESLGLLAGGVAHDFNNLLCVILAGASLVEAALPKSHSLQEAIADIIAASERAAHLTRQMLAYAGWGRFLIEPIDVNELVRSTCELIKASVPRSVRLILPTPAQLPTVQADAGQTQQIVMNLVLNAAEAIDESTGGSVVVKTELVEIAAEAIPKGDLVTGSLMPGSYVVVEVQDSGSGMNEATKAKILEPFFTTKLTGRGLGLAAVGGILRAQNGSLEVLSTLGRGSSFRVYLPASSTPMRHRDTPEDHRKIRGEGAILVVDDEVMVRKVAKMGLEDGGFTVLLASGGQEALRILQSEAAPPISLIVLDLSMPEMSGRQVMQAIRLLGIEVPILICSGYGEAEITREFSGLDIVGFIQKPFTVLQLANRVHSVLSPKPQQQT